MQLHQVKLIATGLLLSVGLTAQAAVTDNLAGHWKLNETGSPTEPSVIDSSGNVANGTNVGATIGVTGPIGTAYDFETDEGDHIEGIPLPSITFGTAETISVWVNAESFRAGTGSASGNTIFADGNNSMGMRLQNQGQLLFFVKSGGTNTNVSSSDVAEKLTTDSWFHIVASRSGSNVSIYINGMLIHSVTNAVSGAMDPFTGNLYIGRQNTSTLRDFDGQIDDLGLWNAAKTAEEVALLHGLGLFAGVSLDNSGIDDVLAVFNNATGSATVGGQTWAYATGLASTTVGAVGGSVGGLDAYIVLDASGNGVQLTAVPEPASIGLMGLGLLLAARRRR